MSGGHTIVGERALVACRWCQELHDCFLEPCRCGIQSHAQRAEYEAWKASGGEGEFRPSGRMLLSNGQRLLPGRKS